MKKVYVDMVGDLFHRGHVELLEAARSFGDFLIVGILSDEVVAAYKRVPVMNLEERTAVIESCRHVDMVLMGAPHVVTSEFLKKYEISCVVHGANISAEAIEEVYKDPQREGKLRLVDHIGGISTSGIIRRVLSGRHGDGTPGGLADR